MVNRRPDASPTRRPTVTSGVLRPFLKLLEDYQLGDSRALHELERDARVPIREAHARLMRAAQHIGDPALGLRAGQFVDFEHIGMLAHLVSSAPTLRAALRLAERFMPLVTDVPEFRFAVDESRAVVTLHSEMPLSRLAADFVASTLHSFLRRMLGTDLPELEWTFSHGRPESIEQYECIFRRARLRFSAPSLGFSFKARALDAALATADGRRHETLLTQTEATLAGVPPSDGMTRLVSELLLRMLPTGDVDVALVARRLGMSRRTLARRLGGEQTSFSILIDDLRRRMALHYLEHTHYPMTEIALMLGFSEVPTFYRAFKRWTRQTPAQFRDRTRPMLDIRGATTRANLLAR